MSKQCGQPFLLIRILSVSARVSAFDFYHTWFDALFLMSVVTTCALLGLHTFSVRAVKLTSE